MPASGVTDGEGVERRGEGRKGRADGQYYPSVKSYFGNGPRIPFDTNLLRAHHPRQLIASAMILLWAGRLGSFLFQVRLLPISLSKSIPIFSMIPMTPSYPYPHIHLPVHRAHPSHNQPHKPRPTTRPPIKNPIPQTPLLFTFPIRALTPSASSKPAKIPGSTKSKPPPPNSQWHGSAKRRGSRPSRSPSCY